MLKKIEGKNMRVPLKIDLCSGIISVPMLEDWAHSISGYKSTKEAFGRNRFGSGSEFVECESS